MHFVALLSVLLVACAQANPVFPPPPKKGGAAVATQTSQVHGGDDVTGISNGKANAVGGKGGAAANQNSIATGGNGATLVADGTSNAHVALPNLPHGVHLPRLPGGGLPRLPGGGAPRVPGGGGIATSNQKSSVHGGDGITGIANGQSTATGRNGAVSNQKSVATGGAGSTLVADGSSSSSTVGKRSVSDANATLANGTAIAKPRVVRSPIRHPPGSLPLPNPARSGVAVANQQSKVRGGDDITGISNGQANALGRKGANANQKSSAIGGNGATLVSDGTASATALGKRSAEREGRARHLPGVLPPTGLGLAIATQDSQARGGAFSNAKATGAANAKGGAGGAIASQHSGASSGTGGSSSASGVATADAQFKRDLSETSSPDVSATVAQAINGHAKDAVKKVAKDPKAVIVSSVSNATNP